MAHDRAGHARQTLTSLRAARRRCEALLSSLGVSTPFDLREFVERLASVRGRPIELVADTRPGQVGLWVEQADRDLIFFPQETSQFHKLLISLHELAHMILDHWVSQGIYVTDPDGNLIELYVDSDASLWHKATALVARSDPLQLGS